jgi:hypothetical protein
MNNNLKVSIFEIQTTYSKNGNKRDLYKTIKNAIKLLKRNNLKFCTLDYYGFLFSIKPFFTEKKIKKLIKYYQND